MIYKLRYGNTNTFFVSGKSGGILVDTDWAGTLSGFYKEIKRCGITLSDIKYVMATHYHPDHTGLISELMPLGVKLVIFDVQRGYIHYSDDIFSRDKRISYKPIDDAEAMIVPIDESRDLLHDIGINGEVLHTPGHSEDSVSLLLDDERTAIVGDLYPYDNIEAYDDDTLRKSWRDILAFSPEIVYYSHANERHFTY